MHSAHLLCQILFRFPTQGLQHFGLVRFPEGLVHGCRGQGPGTQAQTGAAQWVPVGLVPETWKNQEPVSGIW